ncbi:hypothetical protein QBC47DRAFT_54078 [Echria macrotheca]|uniref:Uncharacterized protein n=1 Tax=Echria macrotheca TaxID=438768 RepID=A0AAJ0BAL5_9PEZI|nr:hypothetical protein QBC47DRAFT_54078 [Echria macrotheca]
MDASLQKDPLSEETRGWLLGLLWRPCAPDERATTLSMSPYLDYYSSRCQHFSHDGGIHLCVKSHSGLVDIADMILAGATRGQVCSSLACPPATNNTNRDDIDRTIHTTVDLCGSLLLMAQVGVHKFGFSRTTPLSWSGEQTLRQAVEQHFQPQQGLQPDHPRMNKLFTAKNLSLIAGIKIKWTNNIVDHLLLSDDDQSVAIFHHAEFLKYQQCLKSSPFPQAFIEETLRTLALLLPQNDSKPCRWLLAQITEHALDPCVARCGSLRAQNRRFEHFSVWHDRLVILQQAFDESSPRGIRQWWNDRRNSVQWYTFWVAILVFLMTLFFGLVQSVEGGLQVYLSWKAMNPGTS